MTSQAPGRKPPPDLWLAQTLLDAGIVLGVQAEELRQVEHDGEEGGTVWERAVKRGYATDERIVQALAAQFKIPAADLATADLRASALLPEAVARKHRVVPLAADDRTITLATADPRDLDLEGTLRFVTGRRVVLQLAPPAAIEKQIEEAYRPERTINQLLNGLNPAKLESVEELEAGTERDPALDAPMTRLVDAMITDGVREGASDIHAEPLSDGMSVRYRIDGVLKEVMRLPPNAGPSLVRRVKILAKLDVTDPLHPHDGRAGVRVEGKVIDLRIATVPVARRGEKVVIRILDKANLRANIPDLHLPEGEERLFRGFLGHREGMVLVTGPTGSGKTTTLYAALNELKTGKVNIITVEDPVEYDMPGISQLQVNEAQAFTFATALRSVLRQDPDILLVGEIRDAETADIAHQRRAVGRGPHAGSRDRWLQARGRVEGNRRPAAGAPRLRRLRGGYPDRRAAQGSPAPRGPRSDADARRGLQGVRRHRLPGPHRGAGDHADQRRGCPPHRGRRAHRRADRRRAAARHADPVGERPGKSVAGPDRPGGSGARAGRSLGGRGSRGSSDRSRARVGARGRERR
jgi:type IV pilus assembly protein PilB